MGRVPTTSMTQVFIHLLLILENGGSFLCSNGPLKITVCLSVRPPLTVGASSSVHLFVRQLNNQCKKQHKKAYRRSNVYDCT